MKTVPERIESLRSVLRAHGAQGCILPTSDPHMSEYVPAHWAARAYFSGFTGSAGTLCVTLDKAALWADGRYFVQAAHQLEGSGIELMRIGVAGTPKFADWMAENLADGALVLADGATAPESTCEQLERVFAKKGIRLECPDLLDEAWTEDRTPAPATKAWLLDDAVAGRTAAEKLADVRRALADADADTLVVSRLESTAWLTNLRADDIPHTPFALAFTLVTPESAELFIDAARVPADVQEKLTAQGFAIRPYGEAAAAVRALEKGTALAEPAALSRALFAALRENSNITVRTGRDPILLLKAVKNETERECLKRAHVRDGLAMVKYIKRVTDAVAAGETLTEWDASQMSDAARREAPECFDISFTTIAAYGPNAAMMHYAPAPDTSAKLEPHGFLLTDCGGQYRDGTTDITRTFALGDVTPDERRWYTLVLKCHIALARAVFPEGTTGAQLDAIARDTLWRQGLDYRCGTGHGVGFVGGVHEGPQNVSPRGKEPLRAGMIVTDEPGVYEEDLVGIRTENELLCREWGETEYGRYLCFDVITVCPIDTKPLDTALLTDDELAWLNDYHKRVYETLAPKCTDDERAWLAAACAEVVR